MFFVLDSWDKAPKTTGNFPLSANKMTMGGKGPDSFRMELVTRKTNHVIGGLEFSAIGPDLWGKEQGWRLSLITTANHLVNRTHVMKPS